MVELVKVINNKTASLKSFDLNQLSKMRRLATILSTSGEHLQDNSVQFKLFHNDLNIRLIDKNTFQMTATVPDSNYFAIGFGENMYNTDMILWQAEQEKSRVTDLWAIHHMEPQRDLLQSLNSTFSHDINAETVTFTTTRKFDTEDPYDFLVPWEEPIVMCYASSNGNPDFI